MNSFDDDIIIHPVKTKRDRELPEAGVLFVNPGEAKTAMEKTLQDNGTRRFLHNSNLAVTSCADRFIAGPAVGAPVAALIIEKLIVLGAKRIIQMGWCGAVAERLNVGDIVIPSAAVSGEGTSRYYSNDDQPGPSHDLTCHLTQLFDKNEISSNAGGIWSTDAPYRESRTQLTQLRDRYGVVGVDMEFSALCSVCAFRGIDFASVMVVSDELLGDRWNPGFKNPKFINRCRDVMSILLNDKV